MRGRGTATGSHGTIRAEGTYRHGLRPYGHHTTSVEVPKWHGVKLAGEAGMQAQCDKLAADAGRRAHDILEVHDTATKHGTRGREAAARWGVGSKAIYPINPFPAVPAWGQVGLLRVLLTANIRS